jgi:diaminopimelate epimerase
MHALGNDYILIDAFRQPEILKIAQRLAVRMSDRHFGIGGDGLIFAAPSAKADLAMRMFNADGSESEMCGNGIRQLARFAVEKGITEKRDLAVDTLAGVKPIRISGETGDAWRIEVDMGEPILESAKVPVNAELSEIGAARLTLRSEGREFAFTCVSMGNPHAVTFLSGVKDLDVARYGRPVENMISIFPRRTNVEFVEVLSRNELRMRVWERGSGETLACGTGTCASAVAAVLNGFADRRVTVHLLGGDLFIDWREDNRVRMTGDAVTVFEGEAESSDFLG